MDFTLLIIAGAVAISFLAALVLSARSVVARIAASVVALGIVAFCALGFLASFEPSDSSNLPWQLAYSILGTCSLVTTSLLLKVRSGRATVIKSPN